MLYSRCLNVGVIMPESEAERVAADEDESMGWEEERVEKGRDRSGGMSQKLATACFPSCE